MYRVFRVSRGAESVGEIVRYVRGLGSDDAEKFFRVHAYPRETLQRALETAISAIPSSSYSLTTTDPNHLVITAMALDDTIVFGHYYANDRITDALLRRVSLREKKVSRAAWKILEGDLRFAFFFFF